LPRPVIDPPDIETLLAAWVAIVPNPKFVLEVPAFATSDKLLALTSLASNWVWAFELKVFIYWNSVLVTVPSAIFVASIAAEEFISALTIESSTIFAELTELLASLARVTLASVIFAVVTAVSAIFAVVICESAICAVSILPST